MSIARRFKGDVLRSLIEEANYRTYHEFAVEMIQRGYLRCSGSHVGAWIGGKRPQEDTLRMICAALTERLGRRVSADEMLHPIEE
jgi:hypothetical protein